MYNIFNHLVDKFQVLSELTKTAFKERFNKDPEEQNSEAEIMGRKGGHAMYKAIPEKTPT